MFPNQNNPPKTGGATKPGTGGGMDWAARLAAFNPQFRQQPARTSYRVNPGEPGTTTWYLMQIWNMLTQMQGLAGGVSGRGGGGVGVQLAAQPAPATRVPVSTHIWPFSAAAVTGGPYASKKAAGGEKEQAGTGIIANLFNDVAKRYWNDLYRNYGLVGKYNEATGRMEYKDTAFNRFGQATGTPAFGINAPTGFRTNRNFKYRPIGLGTGLHYRPPAPYGAKMGRAYGRVKAKNAIRWNQMNPKPKSKREPVNPSTIPEWARGVEWNP